MEKIREINLDAYYDLMARESKSCSRAYFRGGMRCKVIENGMAQCFNSVILDGRKKPLLVMLEEIRLYMVETFFTLKQTAQKQVIDVCLGAIKKMDEFGIYVKYLS